MRGKKVCANISNLSCTSMINTQSISLLNINTGKYNIINYPGLDEASPLSCNMYLVNDVIFRKKKSLI